MSLFGNKRRGHRRAISLDDVDAEELINREKLSRQLRVPLSKTISSDGLFTLCEHFLVFGISNKQKEDMSLKCVYKYPPEKEVKIQSLENFCFPSGTPFNSTIRKTLFSTTHSNVADHMIYHSENSFVLLLTSSTKETFYAVCVIDDYFKECPSFITSNDTPSTSPKLSRIPSSSKLSSSPPNSLLSSSPSNSKISSPFSSSSSYKKSMRFPNSSYCYCIISKYPFFDLFLNIHLQILDTEEKMINKSLQDTQNNELNQTIQIIEQIFNQKVPNPGKIIDLSLPLVPKFMRPIHNDTDNQIGEFCIPTLFGSIEVEKILIILSCILLEKNVLFYSSNMRRLTNCIMSCVTLIKPLILQCVFIPVVPDSIIDILYAPVPFIAGLTNKRILDDIVIHNQNDIVIIDLDNRKIHYPPTKDISKSFPLIPNAKEMIYSIGNIAYRLRKTFKGRKIQFRPTNDQKEYSKKIQDKLQEKMLKLLFTRFRSHCITNLSDNVTIFIKESFLDEMNTDEEYIFYNGFFDTQLFDSYCDKRLKEIDNERVEENNKKKTRLKMIEE